MTKRSDGSILSIGIVGAGQIASNVHLPVLLNVRHVRVAWICDRDSTRAQSLARANSVPSAVLGPSLEADIVLLAIPLPGREEWMRIFSARDTAVFVEKPFANAVSDHIRLQSMFSPGKAGVGYQRRFYATSQFLKSAIQERWFGTLRRIVHCEGGRSTRAGTTDYQDAPVSEGGGITKNLGCHGIDLAFFLTGCTDFSVLTQSLERDGDTDRRLAASLQLRGSGDPVQFEVTVSSLDQQPNTITFDFDQAELSCAIRPDSMIRIRRYGAAKPAEIDVRSNGGAFTASQAFFLEWEEFIQAVRSDRPSSIDAATSLQTARAIDALLAHH